MRVDRLAKGAVPDSFWNDPVFLWEFRVASTFGIYAFASFFLAAGSFTMIALAFAGALLVVTTLFRPLRWQICIVVLAAILMLTATFFGVLSVAVALLTFAIIVLLTLFVRPWRPRAGAQTAALTIGGLLAGASCAAFAINSIQDVRDAVLVWPIAARHFGITLTPAQIAFAGGIALLVALAPMIWRHTREFSRAWNRPFHGATYGAIVGLRVTFLPIWTLPSKVAAATRLARDKNTVFVEARGPAWGFSEASVLDEILRRRLVAETTDLHKREPKTNDVCRAVEVGSPERIERAEVSFELMVDSILFSELRTWTVRGTPLMVDEIHRFLIEEGSLLLRLTFSPPATIVEARLCEGWALAIADCSPMRVEALREAIREAKSALRSLSKPERRVIERKIAHARHSLPSVLFEAENPGLVAAYRELLTEFIEECAPVRTEAAFVARDQLKSLGEHIGYCSEAEFEQMLAAAQVSVSAITEEERMQGLLDSAQALLDDKSP